MSRMVKAYSVQTYHLQGHPVRKIRRVTSSSCTTFENKQPLELAIYNAPPKTEGNFSSFDMFKVRLHELHAFIYLILLALNDFYSG